MEAPTKSWTFIGQLGDKFHRQKTTTKKRKLYIRLENSIDSASDMQRRGGGGGGARWGIRIVAFDPSF